MGGYARAVTAFIVILVVLLVLGILGAVIKGLLWLTAIAAVLFVAGAIFGVIRLRRSIRS